MNVSAKNGWKSPTDSPEIRSEPQHHEVLPLQESKQCETWDQAIGLLLEREETLLGDIISECNELLLDAEEQALDMAEILDDEF